jgi:uncharacterized protein YggE
MGCKTMHRLPGVIEMAAALIAAATLSSSGAVAAEPQAQLRTISISAVGSVVAEPDMARITTGVVSESETAQDAVAKNSASMRKVIDGLKAAGIEAKDIQTSGFSVQPRYQYFKDGRPPAITGYTASNQVRIVVRDLNKVGEILDRALSLGSNQIQGISFEVSKAEALKDEARREAFANALRRAQLYAQAAGAQIGQVFSISEEVMGGGPRPAMMARAAPAPESVPVERGSQELQVRVDVTWELK